jgi:serine/threonine-protein kinase
VPWAVAVLSIVGLAATFLSTQNAKPRADENRVVRWALNTNIAHPGNGFGLSRDGRRFAYPAAGDAKQRLWVRELSSLEGQPVAGTEAGKRPFFSPDGQWFAFFTGTARLGHLKKAPVAGGTLNTRGSVTTLCENANLYGASWGDDDRIVFSGPTGLMQVNAAGGPCESLTTADPTEGDHRWPQILPGGASALFTIGIEGAFDSAHVAVLDLKTRKYRTVLDGGANARYVSSGHLIFVRAGQLFAVPFDLNRLQVAGIPQVVIDGIFHVNAGGYAAYAVSDSGTLLYLTQRVEGFEWRDRAGNIQPVTTPPGLYRYFRLSPDGTRVAVQHGGLGDIEVISLDRGVAERVTTEGMNNTPIWSRDGRAVTFATLGKGIYHATLDGRRIIRPLQESVPESAPWDWTPDGRMLVYEKGDPFEIWTLLVGDGSAPAVPQQLMAAPHTSFYHPVVSPDGRWLAYVSNESGEPQVNVQAFPGLGSRVMISREGGEEPRWSKDGRELFYLSSRNDIMVVEVRAGGRFSAESPKVLIPSAGNFDVDPTGQRFLILKQERPEQLQAVVNWFGELTQRVSR